MILANFCKSQKTKEKNNLRTGFVKLPLSLNPAATSPLAAAPEKLTGTNVFIEARPRTAASFAADTTTTIVGSSSAASDVGGDVYTNIF